MRRIVLILESIKFSHTIFAMPFALLALLLSRRGSLPSLQETFLIIGAMVGARTWAMGINRLVDHKIDSENPRTRGRALPAGLLERKHLWALSIFGAMLLCVCSALLSFLCFWLSFPLLGVLASYSVMKRYTAFCHFWLGFCLSCAPLGAWIALNQSVELNLLYLCFGILFWVAGFDIIYAIQDFDFDRQTGLHSVPVLIGISWSRKWALFCHVLSLCFFSIFGWQFNLGRLYLGGVLCSGILLIAQHVSLFFRPSDSVTEARFFRLNGWVAVVLFLGASWQLVFGT